MDSTYLLQAIDAEKKLHPLAFQYDIIFAALRWAIITERFSVGLELRTGEIAELLNLSRTPVARAIGMLEAEHLVTNISKSTYTVAAPDYQSIHDIMEFRYMLEPAIAYSAAKNSTSADIAELEMCLSQFQALDTTLSDRLEYVDAAYRTEVAFHTKICNMCNNLYIQRSWMENLTSVCRAIYFTNRSGLDTPAAHVGNRSDRSYNSHAPIVYSIRIHDGRMAMEACYSHLRKINLKCVNY